MTVSTVAADDPVEASTMNQLIAKINGSPNRQVFTSNGTFTVPAGCHKFRVLICGAGGAGGDDGTGGGGEDFYTIPGGEGGYSPLYEAYISGQDIGSSFSVTVGAGGTGTGGTSSFGTLISVTGGGKGSTGASSGMALRGSTGSASGSAASGALRTECPFVYTDVSGEPRSYGSGGLAAGTNGYPGIVIVEW